MKAQDPRIFQFLVEKSPDGHFVVRDGVFEYLNGAALRMFGYEGQGVEQLRVADILHSSDHERARRNMALRSSGVLRGSASYLAQRRDGSTFPIEVHAAPVQRGEKRGIHGVIRDITARRTMEKQLEEMQRTSVVSRLASGISHDFNNLLAVIQTNAEFALRVVGGSEAEASLQRIRAAAQRGAQKVRQIQQIGGSRPEHERFQPLHVNPVVEDVLDLTRARWQDEADSRGVSYDVSWSPGTPSAIDGSSSELRAALVALVFNALESMADGGELSLRTGETEQGEVLIEVKDSGEGIRREDLARLTDAFFTTRSDRRMGLGLHLVQMFVERHGGHLDVRSTRGEGSSVSMILPASDEAPEEPAPPLRRDLLARSSGPTVPEPVRPRTRGGRSILLIDDQADLVQVVRTILESRGFSVDAALSGREGIALAEASRYSLVLTDLGMPDTSGWEVAQRVLEVQPKTPVILMTGWAADIDEARLRDSRIEALLPKPFRSEQLLQLVSRVLEPGGSTSS